MAADDPDRRATAREVEAPGTRGRCACGAIRYELASEPFDAGYCHCRICQLTSGAPVMAFATVPVADYRVIAGEPLVRRSSALAERSFCGDCGTPLTIHADYQADTIDFTIATLDRPGTIFPAFHIWTGSRIDWFDTDDSYPRHAGFRADTRGMDERVAAGGDVDGHD